MDKALVFIEKQVYKNGAHFGRPIGIVVAIISIIWIFKVIFGTNAVCEDAKGNYFKEYA